MEPTEIERKERYFTQYLAEKHAALVFDDLIEFASDICLSRPLPDSVPTQVSGERTIVNLFGARGIRTAMEINNPKLLLDAYQRRTALEEETKEEEEDPATPYVTLMTPLNHPDLFSTGLDASIQEKIVSFGEAMIEESYTILGPDAEAKIKALREASTAEEQMKIVKWLDKRLDTIVRHGKEESDGPAIPEDPFAYQPYRLSPKVIGQYPNTLDRPTCLGVSIIATSFFKHAGLEMLHAGVNMSGDESTVFTGYELTHKVTKKVGNAFGIVIPEPAEAAIHRTSEKMEQQMTRNDAQHAAVYVKLLDGTWAQFDPNYAATRQLTFEGATSFLTSMHTSLNEIKPLAPGVELTGVINDNFVPTATILDDIIENLPEERIHALKEQAEKTLRNISETAMAETIFEDCIAPFFHPENLPEGLQEDLQYLALTRRDVDNTDEIEPVLRTAFYSVLEKYVQWGASPEEFIHRLQTDEAYFQNRVEDITMLPFMIMVGISKTEAEDFTPWYSHLLLEFGLPEYRIGAAVLSDFSLYYDFPLPPSFWMSYWPGNASVVEHLVGDVSVRGDFAVSFNNALYHHLHPFTSFKNSGIINSFLEDNDGRGE